MSATVVYLENALVPCARRVEAVEPASIQSLAPVDWVHPFIAFLDGKPVLRADWELVVEDGQALAFIDVNAIPQGDGGGGSDALRTVAMIAIMVAAGPAAIAMGFTGLAAAAVGTGLALVGAALVNAILPAPKPTTPQQAAALAAASPTYSLQAQGNSARIDAAIPEHFGRMLAYPDFAAQPYVEYSGNEQYLYQLLCIGRGDYDIEAIRIEDTPISNFPDIECHVVRPNDSIYSFPSGAAQTNGVLFPANVVSSVEVSGQELVSSISAGPFVASASGTSANYLGIDYVMSRGLYYANDDGGLNSLSVTVKAEAQRINDSGVALTGWLTLGTETITAATTTPQRKSFKYTVPTPGRYQVRVTRTDAKSTSARAGHEVAWAGLRAYLPDTRDYGDVTLLAMKMRASNNLSMQASRKINVICTRKIPTWNGSAWTGNVATRSIAWPIAYACKAVGLSDAQIDLAGLRTLDTTWAARGDYFDARFDQFLGFWEAITKIAQAGRAKPFMQGGVMRIMRDQAVSVPVAMFSMRNIVKGSFNVDYLMPTADTADVIKASYFDSAKWTSATVTAKLPGSSAAKPAKVDFFGIVGRDQSYREAMYIAATNRYRRKLIKFSTEMEGFIPSFGDLITIQHDMPGWGQGGEVVAWNSATRTLSLTETPVWKAGSNHYIGLRRRDGSAAGPYLVTPGFSTNDVVVSGSEALTIYTGADEERTHFAFGWADTYSQRARILSVKPSSLTQVSIECVNEDDNVHTADQGITTPVRQTSQLAGYVNAPPVLGLTAVSSPNARHKMVVSWAASPWANSYIVQQSANAGADWVTIGEVGGTSLTAQAISESSTTVRVAAIGIAQGAWAQCTYTMPALESVLGLGIEVTNIGIRLGWTQAVDQDYECTIIKIGGSWASAAEVTRKAASSHLLNFAAAGPITVWAAHLDRFGNLSPTPVSATITIAAPSPAQQLTLGFGTANIEAAWVAPIVSATQQPLARVELSWAPAFTTIIDGKSATTTTFGWLAEGTHTLYARYIDAAGNVGTVNQATLQVLPPAQPVMTAVETQINAVTLRWQDAKTSQPIRKYAIYYGDAGTALASATLYGSAGADSRSDILFYRAAGTKVAYLVAEDVAGNLSAARQISVSITMPNDFVLASEYYEDWQPAEVTNGNIIGGANGQIILPSVTGRTWGQRLSNSGWTTAQQKVDAGFPIVTQPVPASGKHVETRDIGKVLATAVIRVTPTLQSSVPGFVATLRIRVSVGDSNTTWQDWLVGDAATFSNFRYLEVEYAVTSDGKGFVVLDDLYVKVEINEVTESAVLVLNALDAAGTAYVCTKTFQDLRSAIASALSSPNIARINCIVDDATTPARVYVQAWDTTNTRTSGTVSLYLSGV